MLMVPMMLMIPMRKTGTMRAEVLDMPDELEPGIYTVKVEKVELRDSYGKHSRLCSEPVAVMRFLGPRPEQP